MKNLRVAWLATLLALLLVFALSCESGGDDDDAIDDDATGDDDTGDDDDQADDDTGDDDDLPPGYCETLSWQEINLLGELNTMGASDTVYDNEGGPYGLGEYTQYYYGKLVNQAWPQLALCDAPDPQFWVVEYKHPWKLRESATLFIDVGSFFHLLDDDPSLTIFRLRVRQMLTTSTNEAPNALMLWCNIPVLAMINYDGDKQAVNRTIAEEVAAYPAYHLVDLDWYYAQVLLGKVRYNGEPVYIWQIMTDVRHINERGHQLVADVMVLEINEIFPNIQLPTSAELEFLP
ncbi:MAG: hypothetical protein P9M14_00705 [Candidatus Alcyoniella australis]|nr:hypothetical protein [Candidatus Alcyoniella australis]